MADVIQSYLLYVGKCDAKTYTYLHLQHVLGLKGNKCMRDRLLDGCVFFQGIQNVQKGSLRDGCNTPGTICFKDAISGLLGKRGDPREIRGKGS